MAAELSDCYHDTAPKAVCQGSTAKLAFRPMRDDQAISVT